MAGNEEDVELGWISYSVSIFLMFIILGNTSHQGGSAAGESSSVARVGMQDSRSGSCSCAVGECTSAHGLHRVIPFQAIKRDMSSSLVFSTLLGVCLCLFPALSMPLRAGGLCNS